MSENQKSFERRHKLAYAVNCETENKANSKEWCKETGKKNSKTLSIFKISRSTLDWISIFVFLYKKKKLNSFYRIQIGLSMFQVEIFIFLVLFFDFIYYLLLHNNSIFLFLAKNIQFIVTIYFFYSCPSRHFSRNFKNVFFVSTCCWLWSINRQTSEIN